MIKKGKTREIERTKETQCECEHNKHVTEFFWTHSKNGNFFVIMDFIEYLTDGYNCTIVHGI